METLEEAYAEACAGQSDIGEHCPTLRGLAALRPDCTIYTANAHNDVSFGALRLVQPALVPAGALVQIAPLEQDLTAYRDRWRARVAAAVQRGTPA